MTITLKLPLALPLIAALSGALMSMTTYGMVWYGNGAPPTPRQCVLSLRVVASCSVHPVSERHRQAMQSTLVRRWVRPCDAGIGKGWNRGCLHETKSSGISLRCTCLALPATRWLDDPRERAVHRLIGRCTVRRQVPLPVPLPLGLPLGLAIGGLPEARVRCI